MADAVPAMVEGCRKHGVPKLVFQSCSLAIAPGERAGWFSQITMVRTIVRWQLGSTVVDDNEAVMQYLSQEVHDVDWVVTRPAGLVDGDSLGPVVPCLDPFKKTTVRYVDVADWTLAQVESG